MNTLSKEHFDERMDAVETRFDEVDTRLGGVDKRINAMDKRFKAVDQHFDALATMIARGFDDIPKRLDVRERVDSLEKKMATVESALNVRL